MSQNKRIDATNQNPERERLLYAPLVQMNINKFIKQLKSEDAWKKDDHNTITIYKSESTTIVLRGMHKKSLRKSGKVNSDATIQVLKGKIKIHVEGCFLYNKTPQNHIGIGVFFFNFYLSVILQLL